MGAKLCSPSLLLLKAGAQPGHLPEIPFPSPQDCSLLQRNSRTWCLLWPFWETRKYLDIKQEFDGTAALTQNVGNHQKKAARISGRAV